LHDQPLKPAFQHPRLAALSGDEPVVLCDNQRTLCVRLVPWRFIQLGAPKMGVFEHVGTAKSPEWMI